MMIDQPTHIEMLWQRIHNHIPAEVIATAGEPTIAWHRAPVGETPVFTFRTLTVTSTSRSRPMICPRLLPRPRLHPC
jgi:hypothetical protein